ncbi:MAG: hypothetical protein ACP5VE_04545 [Chthonomonadales bacterium]
MRRLLPSLIALAALAALVRLLRFVQAYEPGAEENGFYREAGLGAIAIRLGRSRVAARSGGMLQWTVVCDRVDLQRRPGGDVTEVDRAEFAGLHEGTVYRGNRPEATFSARSATYDRLAQQWVVRGDISVQIPPHDHIRASSLVWFQADDTVQFPSGAEAQFGADRIKAPVLFFSPRARRVECPQGAEGVVGGYPVRTSALFWDLAKGLVEMPGQVWGSRPGYDYSAQGVRLQLKPTPTFRANKGRLLFRIEGGAQSLYQSP